MRQQSIETITHKTQVIAIILRKDFHSEGISFLTEADLPLQLGYMSHPKGHEIVPHVHKPTRRVTFGTYEVLYIKSGHIRIDFFSHEQQYLESREAATGDLVLLVGAGHGIVMLEPTIMIETKNGPYFPDADKQRFTNPNTTTSKIQANC